MSGNARDCFCNECGRKKGTGPADARWWVLMTIGGGLHVTPWIEPLAALTNYHACGDRCVSLEFAHYIATGKLDKPRHPELPSFFGTRGATTLYCLNCGRESPGNPASSALVHCQCGGTNFGNTRRTK